MKRKGVDKNKIWWAQYYGPETAAIAKRWAADTSAEDI